MYSGFYALIISIVLGACGQIFLKVAVNRMGGVDLSIRYLLPTLMKLATNGWLLAGLIMFGISMLLWLKVISNTDLSRAYPTVSLSYVIVFLVSVFLFKEGVTLSKIIGMICILVGVFLMHR